MKKQNAIKTVTKMLIAFATLIVSSTASVLFFGEPECPESLRKLDK